MLGPATRRFASRFATWAFVACSLFGALSPAQGLVLCVEAEGSVSIESAFGESCCTERPELPQPGEAGDEARAQPDSSRCLCIDVPLASVSDQRRAPHGSVLVFSMDALADAAGSAVVRLDDPADRCRRVRHDVRRAAASLVVERSVVLVV